MSREPRGVTGHKFVASTDPYLKQQVGQSSTAVAAAAAATAPPTTTGGEPPTITNMRQFETLQRRTKPLPPDANQSAIPKNTTLYQLENRVYFSCSTCRKNKILSDLFAANSEFGQFTCSRCFTKLIRPKNFTPTRLVPFPSLLSWLNFQKPSVMDMTSVNAQKVSQRAAEAVVPTGDRLATGLAVNGFTNTDVRALPSTGMIHTINTDDSYGQAALHEMQLTHPCNRVWGANKCAHGSLCAFAKAPFNQAIEYLMGIATKEQCEAEGMIVNDVFNLPNAADPLPTQAYGVDGSSAAAGPSPAAGPTGRNASASDIRDPSTPLGQWYARRLKTLNQPEWQLFHNGNVEDIINKYVVFEYKYQTYNTTAAATVESAAAPTTAANNDDNDDNLAAFFEEDTAAPNATANNDNASTGITAEEAAAEAQEAHMATLMEDDDEDDLGALLDAL